MGSGGTWILMRGRRRGEERRVEERGKEGSRVKRKKKEKGKKGTTDQLNHEEESSLKRLMKYV